GQILLRKNHLCRRHRREILSGRNDLLRDLLDVPALVPVFRKGERLALDLLEARLDGKSEVADLPTGVIDVKLRRNRVAQAAKNSDERIAQRRAAPVTDVERARGIGGDELEQNFLALRRGRGVARSVAERCEFFLERGVAQPKIQKAGARGLDFLNEIG